MNCAHMYFENGDVNAKIPRHGAHVTCAGIKTRDESWLCKAEFCLIMRTTWDLRPVQLIPTFSEDMKKAMPTIFHGNKIKKEGVEYIEDLSRNGWALYNTKTPNGDYGSCCSNIQQDYGYHCEHCEYKLDEDQLLFLEEEGSSKNAAKNKEILSNAEARKAAGKQRWLAMPISSYRDILLKIAPGPTPKKKNTQATKLRLWADLKISAIKVQRARELQGWKAEIIKFLKRDEEQAMASCVTIVDMKMGRDVVPPQSIAQYNTLALHCNLKLFRGSSASLCDCDKKLQAALRGIARYLKNPDHFYLGAVRLMMCPAGWEKERHIDETLYQSSTALLLEGRAALTTYEGESFERHGMFFGEAREEWTNDDEIILKTIDLRDKVHSVIVGEYTCVWFMANFFERKRF